MIKNYVWLLSKEIKDPFLYPPKILYNLKDFGRKSVEKTLKYGVSGHPQERKGCKLILLVLYILNAHVDISEAFSLFKNKKELLQGIICTWLFLKG